MFLKSKYLLVSMFIAIGMINCYANKKADSLHVIAVNYFNQGDYASMLEKTLEILKLCEDSGNLVDKTNAMMNVGRAYYHLQQKQTCLAYMLAARKIALDINNDSLIIKTARQAGAVYCERSNADSAMLLLKEAERGLKKTKDYGELSSVYSLMGDIECQQKKQKETGWKYYNEAEKLGLKSGNKNSIAFAYMKKGVYMNEEGNCDRAEGYYRKALAVYSDMNMVEGVMYAMGLLAKCLSNCGKGAESYELMLQLHQIRDTIFKAETAKKTAQFRTMYETEKKEKENIVLANDNALKKLQIANEIKSKRLLGIIFISSALGLIIIFLVIYNRYKWKKKGELDRELARQEKMRFESVIEAEENERKRIAADLHDGVGQLMSAAKINLVVMQNELHFETEEQRLTFAKAIALVDESCGEVRTVSHNMMPNVLLKSGLVNAIRAFLLQIDERVLKINLYTDGLNEKIGSNIETVLYRIVQECVNNVIKHAAADKMDISIIKDEEGISATIEDNGKGFDARNENFEGIGLKNIKSRVSYLNGTVEWDSSPGKGTLVAIFVPLKS